jgi:hypothetical protein
VSAGVKQAVAPHWSDAAYHWHEYGSPLRPSADDVAAIEALVRNGHGDTGPRPLSALLLGVTPEIATMAWPPRTELLAIDRSRPMLEHVWPGDIDGRRRAVCGDWFDFAWETARHDIVVGDGIFAILDFPRQYRTLAASIRAALAPDGVFVTRLFLQSPQRETPGAVFDDLLANRIGSFHAFKMRLAMAMQDNATAGVRMGDVYAAWRSANIDPDALAAITGWSHATIETIRPWAEKPSRLSFPLAGEMDAAMADHFDKHAERTLAYELGERCPVVAYRPRAHGTAGR